MTHPVPKTDPPALPRREALARLLAMGLSLPTAHAVLAQTGPAPAPAPAYAPTRRGGGGTLRILSWQGPTQLNPHFATGTKDADAALESLAPAENVCEPFEACCRPKVLCIAETGHAAGDQLDETFAEFTAKLEAAMVAYDALNFSQWKFAPIAPVLKCNVAP